MAMDNVDKIKQFISNEGGAVMQSKLTKYCWNNGIMLVEQNDALAQLIAQGWCKEDLSRGKAKWYVKT
jgi:hypothetical protein